MNSAVTSEPTTVSEALNCNDKELWKEAMDVEMKSLHANHVWDLVPPSKDKKLVKSKWVFKCKCGENGMVERYKATLSRTRLLSKTRNRLRRNLLSCGSFRVYTNSNCSCRSKEDEDPSDGYQDSIPQW